MTELFCIGNAMVDVFARVPPDFYGQFGLTAPIQHIDPVKAGEILAALQTCPPGNALDPAISSGGGAANTAKIASVLGIRSAFAGAVGSDAFAGLFKEEMERSGVSLYLSSKKSSTGVFISLNCENPDKKDKEGRCIAASPSAALEFDAEDLTTIFSQSLLTDHLPRVVYIDGFLLNRERLMRCILELVEKYRLCFALDLGTVDIAAAQAALARQGNSFFWDRKPRRFPMILFFNEKEAEIFAKVLGAGWESLFLNAAGYTSVLIAVKLAERGTAVFSGGAVYHVKAEPVKAMESTGAGDAYAAGFLASWLRGENPPQCGQAGNEAAALVLGSPGTSVLPFL
ncbi:MAG: PfkB family carbohydrate kinase [Treponema sp.]|nr:PfkB family carbohydrate kinase [Treponema sp.]